MARPDESLARRVDLVRERHALVVVDAGDRLLGGDDITAMSQARFASSPGRRQIQIVFQDATESLNPSFRVFQSIADPRRLSRTAMA